MTKLGRKDPTIRSRDDLGRIVSVRTPWREQDGILKDNGYVYVYLPEHHLANSQGWTKRANLVWEEENGRLLPDDFIVHHKDDNKQNDDLMNLELMSDNEHKSLEACKRWDETPVLENPEIECECGCGERFKKFPTRVGGGGYEFTSWTKPKRFATQECAARFLMMTRNPRKRVIDGQ